MRDSNLEQLRLPAAVLLIAVLVLILLPRGTDSDAAAVPSSPGATPVAGLPGGAVVAPPTAAPSSTPPPPTSTPAPTPTATPEESEPPPADDGFTAQVLACRSISGSQCNGQLGTLPAGAASFTALVRFTDARAGDAINVILSGPAGEIAGGPYTLGGGGDGYFYSTFTVAGLPSGDYGLVATRNGDPVATTTFRRGG